MQKARIDDKGTELAFLDSEGPPDSNNYFTVVIVHGHTFHAKNFSRLLPLAAKYNIRVIALNRRDYVGSTPFSQSELDDLHSSDETKHKVFLRDRGLEIARFLVWVIDKLRIPPRSIVHDGGTSRTSGGLAILGWSLGNITTIEFLSNLKTYPQDVITKLEPYMSTSFLYECAYAVCGYEQPDGDYYPLIDSDIPQRLRASESDKRTSRSLASLELRIPQPHHHTKTPTNERIPPSELLDMVDTVPGARSGDAYHGNARQEAIYATFKQGLLLDEGIKPGTTSSLLPNIKVVSIYGTRSMWFVQYAVWKTEEDLENWKAAGRHIRPFAFLKADGCNHFMHWDDPDVFLQLLSEGITQ